MRHFAPYFALLALFAICWCTSSHAAQCHNCDGPAQLPRTTVHTRMSYTPAPGSVIYVAPADNLQQALDSARCGDIIQLQAGTTFTGVFQLPAKNCDTNHWIIVRTSSPDSTLPREYHRVTPCYAGIVSLVGRPAYKCKSPSSTLAKIAMQSPGDGPLRFASGANFYRLLGLEITRTDGLQGHARLISLEGTADHIILDRSWLHGNPHDETSDGFALSGGTFIGVIDSYFNDFHCISKVGTCTDAHAISGGTGDSQDGPFKVRNNFLEASGEAILFGGGEATKTPADIQIIHNHFWKPWLWMQGNPQFVGSSDGHPFVVKNHLELKNAQRVLVEANLMENNWGGFSQNGFGIVLTPKNQHTPHGDVCPLCQVTDVTIRYGKLSHLGAGMQLATARGDNGNAAPAFLGERWSIHDLVMDDISVKYKGGGTAFEIINTWPTNALNTVSINHVTAFPDPSRHMITTGNLDSNSPMYGLRFTNNIILTGTFPLWNAIGGGVASCAYSDIPVIVVSNCYSTYTFTTNALIASPEKYSASQWPSGNYFPGSPAAVGFVDYNNGNGGNYELQDSSLYKNQGSDGKDLGADVVRVNAALSGVQ